MNTAFLSGATLVFDLDGTLVDTAPDLVGTLNHILGERSLPAVTTATLRPFINYGARRMLVEGLKLAGETREDGQLDEMFEQFLDHYAGHAAVESAPYPNVTGVLDRARAAGARLGICTNKREDLSRILLGELALIEKFDAILGRDTLEVHKPDPLHLTETVARAGGRSTRAIMVGDSTTDVAVAKAAGIPVIAVSFGYSDMPAHELGADAVIDDYSELFGAARELLGE